MAGLALLASLASCVSLPPVDAGVTPQIVVSELLAADRTFAAAGTGGLASMLAPTVVMPVPQGQFARGAADVVTAVLGSGATAFTRLEWTPVRGGVSADGMHGFTFGYMTGSRADSTRQPLKYLAYWVKSDAGWHVVAYRRARRPAGEVSLALMSPALPDRMVAITTDPATLAAQAESLVQAELAFSTEAQSIGLGRAFAKFGSTDAMNMGGPASPGFILGADAIGNAIGNGSTAGATISWASDQVIVASSGDLGVSIGVIRPNAPATGGASPSGSTFFTVWRRASLGAPWRYIAE